MTEHEQTARLCDAHWLRVLDTRDARWAMEEAEEAYELARAAWEVAECAKAAAWAAVCAADGVTP